MDIASLSVSLAQDRLTEQVSSRLMAMSLKTAEGAGSQLQDLFASAETVSDPALGKLLDTVA
jgi:hypothetical protein